MNKKIKTQHINNSNLENQNNFSMTTGGIVSLQKFGNNFTNINTSIKPKVIKSSNLNGPITVVNRNFLSNQNLASNIKNLSIINSLQNQRNINIINNQKQQQQQLLDKQKEANSSFESTINSVIMNERLNMEKINNAKMATANSNGLNQSTSDYDEASEHLDDHHRHPHSSNNEDENDDDELNNSLNENEDSDHNESLHLNGVSSSSSSDAKLSGSSMMNQLNQQQHQFNCEF